jgi:hypothetical protein
LRVIKHKNGKEAVNQAVCYHRRPPFNGRRHWETGGAAQPKRADETIDDVQATGSRQILSCRNVSTGQTQAPFVTQSFEKVCQLGAMQRRRALAASFDSVLCLANRFAGCVWVKAEQVDME